MRPSLVQISAEEIVNYVTLYFFPKLTPLIRIHSGDKLIKNTQS